MTLIPKAAFEQHIILLGKTRSGKSSVARLLVEHLLDQGKPVCIVDPKGDWYGLKASADGKKAGYPVVIFGGEHGDVPLNSRSGAAVAELLATGNRSAIVDLGGWMPGDRTQFWIDFASTYFRTHKGRHWLVIDEIHNVCPKGKIMDPNAGKMLHWSNRLASEGLGKGISMIAASQRPQKVHNDFLTSCETLIAMRVIHAADRGAIEDWIDGCGDPEKGKEVVACLASMKRGEAWAWCPEAEFGPKRIQFPMFKTYDSFRPRGASEVRLKGWAEVNLEEVKKKLESAVKEAEANDPTKLRQRIRALEVELKNKRPQPTVYVQPVTADKRAIERAEQAARHAAHSEYRVATAQMERRLKDVAKALEATSAFLSSQGQAMVARAKPLLEVVKASSKCVAIPTVQTKAVPQPSHTKIVDQMKTQYTQTMKADRGIAYKAPNLDGNLPKGERSVLIAVAQHDGGIERDTVTVLTGYKQSTRNAYIQRLQEKHLVQDRSGVIVATEEGVVALGSDFEPLPKGQELREHWGRTLPEGERRIFAALVQRYPNAVERDVLTDETGYKASTRNAYLQRLGARRLVEVVGRNEVKASANLFD